MKAGEHAFTVTFFQKGGGYLLNLSYDGPGIAKQLVPASKIYRINIKPYEIKIYPNPTREKLNLFSGSSIKTGSEILVYNSLGQLVMKSLVTGRNSEINTSKLQSGIYYIHLLVDGKKITGSFIKTQR